MLTKGQSRTVIRGLLNDEANRRWGDAALDVLTQTTIDGMWGEILDFAPWFASQLDNITSDSSGLVDLTNTGSLTRRFFKVQTLVKDSQEFFPTHPRDFVMQSGLQVTAPDNSYFPMGGKLYAFPLESACLYELRYNFLPTAYTSTSETGLIQWVDGFENAFLFKTAALAIVRDSIELFKTYMGVSAESYDALCGKIKREYVGPATIKNLDDPFDHGGT